MIRDNEIRTGGLQRIFESLTSLKQLQQLSLNLKLEMQTLNSFSLILCNDKIYLIKQQSPLIGSSIIILEQLTLIS